MKLKESKLFKIHLKIMLCCVLAILVLGVLYIFVSAAFKGSLIANIIEKLFFFDLILSSVLLMAFIAMSLISATNEVEHIADLSEAPEEFERIFENLKDGPIQEIEKLRKKLSFRRNIEKILRILLVLLIFAYAFLNSFVYGIKEIYIISAIVIGLSYMLINKGNKRKFEEFQKQYKENVVNKMMEYMGYNNLKFIPKNPESELFYENLYESLYRSPQDGNSYYRNYIEGLRYSDLNVKLTDMCLVNKLYGNRSIPQVYFSGYFGYIEFKKSVFNGFSIIKKGFKKDSVRETNNEFFDENFVLKSTNERFKAGLIRDGIADAIARFYSATNLELQIETRDSKIFLKIFSSSIFEPSVSSNYKEKVYTQYEFLNELFILIDELYEIVKNNSY